MGRGVTAEPAAAAECVLRLAVLLQAGVAPARAWSHLAAAGDIAAGRVVESIEAGTPLSAAIADAAGSPQTDRRARGAPRTRDAHRAWREIAAAWEVATHVGAPLAESLRGLAATLRDVQEAADDVRVALAEPAATARLMGWLPLVAVVLGIALGFDTIGTLVANPIGWVCSAAGAVLIVAGQRWNAALVRRARAEAGMPGLDTELLAIALSGGVSIERAQAIVRAALEATRASDADLPQDDATARREDGAEDILTLSRTAGVPAVELLRAAAALARHRARVDGRLRAAKLSSRLLLPLGVCTLPAFLLLGVAPMLLSVMTAVPIQL
ncbi:type II secretion system F family protein [Microbacterium pygmaeum]|uniref:Tight adherence protein B n=1 Tax=Microbacterium pygmaeum TaxID=370764 RepID=A0A1G7Y214_9MICO|nr:type II secretion system F family protein [Microbacterium pygmaeum]SDG90441.1 tight adherence protein B [Microbacterium pygmaeum]